MKRFALDGNSRSHSLCSAAVQEESFLLALPRWEKTNCTNNVTLEDRDLCVEEREKHSDVIMAPRLAVACREKIRHSPPVGL
jgi:hypothetical protein